MVSDYTARAKKTVHDEKKRFVSSCTSALKITRSL